MKKIYNIIALGASVIMLSACFGIDEENFKTLEPITFNEVSDVIDTPIGAELVYDKLVVDSELPCTYEWAYGPRKTTGAVTDENEMVSMEVISDKADIRYTFTRLGQYVLRLKVDNGESIEYKYFTLNVNSGLDEGLLILSNDTADNGYLTFIKKRSADEEAANAQEVWDNVFTTINPSYTLSKVTDMYMTEYTAKGISYSQLLVSTADGQGSLYKLDPQTFELYSQHKMMNDFGTYCASLTGESAASTAYYVLMAGADGHTYRYDCFADFVGERADVSAAVSVTGTKNLVYATSATGKTNRKFMMHNSTSLVVPGNGDYDILDAEGYDMVNFFGKRLKNEVYVLLRSQSDPTSYVIKQTTATLSTSKWKNNVTTFTAASVSLNEESRIVNTFISDDVYFSNGTNGIYRWGLTTKPADAPVITLPAGEIVCDLATNFKPASTGSSADSEDLLYIATYNANRGGEKKGSLYIYSFADHTLVKSYEGLFYEPVRLMYKYRI